MEAARLAIHCSVGLLGLAAPAPSRSWGLVAGPGWLWYLQWLGSLRTRFPPARHKESFFPGSPLSSKPRQLGLESPRVCSGHALCGAWETHRWFLLHFSFPQQGWLAVLAALLDKRIAFLPQISRHGLDLELAKPPLSGNTTEPLTTWL